MLGDFDASCGRLEKLAKSSREVIEVIMTAGVQSNCGDYKGAAKSYQKALQISPHFSAWIKVYYTYVLLQNGDIEAAKQYALEQSEMEHAYSRGNESFLAILACIAQKEGNEKLARKYFDKQNAMEDRATKWDIEYRDFSSARDKSFVKDYVEVLQSLGMPNK
jgi:Tfp pilus assembly protein PilF